MKEVARIMPRLSIKITKFAELDLYRLYRIMCLRDRVFVVGQGITAESELDGRDPDAWHVEAYSGDRLVATARLFVSEDPISVGRIAVDHEIQRTGYGTEMMHWVNDWLGERRAEMHAQAHLEPWYSRLGWMRTGDVFMEADIPHVTMRWGNWTV